MGKKWKVIGFVFLGSKITANGDCSHEMKRCLLLGTKAMTNLDNILNTETSLWQQMSIYTKLWFLHVWMWELTHKRGWALKNWCFQTLVLEKTLESPLDSREIKPVNPAAAAKLLQSCPTLSDPMDSSPPGSSVHRILQARILEWVAFSFSASQS